MENTEILPILEPLLGISLALNLAYLNLPIFSFLSTISEGVNEKIASLSDATKAHVADTPWYKDAIEIAKVRSLEKMQFNDGFGRWTPFKSKFNALCFNVIFRYRVGKLVSLSATVLISMMIISGVEVQIWPMDEGVKYRSSLYPSPFLLSIFAFLWPIFCIATGSWVRYSTASELNYNLKNLGDQSMGLISDAVGSAEAAVNDSTYAAKASGKVMLGK